MRDKNVAPVESLLHSTSIKQGEKDLAPPLKKKKQIISLCVSYLNPLRSHGAIQLMIQALFSMNRGR